jgi:hypothetical protein
MEESIPPQTVTAVPDMVASPNEPKKAKLSHIDMDQPETKEEDSEEGDSTGDISPIIQAIPLPADDIEIQEEWWDLKMVWSGTTYDIKVGGNDM